MLLFKDEAQLRKFYLVMLTGLALLTMADSIVFLRSVHARWSTLFLVPLVIITPMVGPLLWPREYSWRALNGQFLLYMAMSSLLLRMR